MLLKSRRRPVLAAVAAMNSFTGLRLRSRSKSTMRVTNLRSGLRSKD